MQKRVSLPIPINRWGWAGSREAGIGSFPDVLSRSWPGAIFPLLSFCFCTKMLLIVSVGLGVVNELERNYGH